MIHLVKHKIWTCTFWYRLEVWCQSNMWCKWTLPERVQKITVVRGLFHLKVRQCGRENEAHMWAATHPPCPWRETNVINATFMEYSEYLQSSKCFSLQKKHKTPFEILHHSSVTHMLISFMDSELSHVPLQYHLLSSSSVTVTQKTTGQPVPVPRIWFHLFDGYGDFPSPGELLRGHLCFPSAGLTSRRLRLLGKLKLDQACRVSGKVKLLLWLMLMKIHYSGKAANSNRTQEMDPNKEEKHRPWPPPLVYILTELRTSVFIQIPKWRQALPTLSAVWRTVEGHTQN